MKARSYLVALGCLLSIGSALPVWAETVMLTAGNTQSGTADDLCASSAGLKCQMGRATEPGNA